MIETMTTRGCELAKGKLIFVDARSLTTASPTLRSFTEMEPISLKSTLFLALSSSTAV